MRRQARILELFLILAALSLLGRWAQTPTVRPTPLATNSPPPVASPTARPSATPASPSGGQPAWLKAGLKLELEVLSADGDLKHRRLKLRLHNSAAVTAYIPGTFCQQGEKSDWWSHAVRVRVTNGQRKWRLGPGYGTRALHEHPSYPMSIGPGQTLSWEFHLEALTTGVDGEPSSAEGWEELRGPVDVTCELVQQPYSVESNPLRLL